MVRWGRSGGREKHDQIIIYEKKSFKERTSLDFLGENCPSMGPLNTCSALYAW